MPAAVLNDADFIEMFERLGPAEMSRQLDMRERSIYYRRSDIEKRIGRTLACPDNGRNNRTRSNILQADRARIEVRDGVVMVGSDAHYWPDRVSTAHRAFVHFAKKLKPVAVVLNGDMVDGASISRHPPINWESRPSVIQEIETVQERTEEIRKAAPKAQRFWPLGNHDARFEARLASVAPEFAKVHGMHLKDHFPWWEPCWALWINDDVVVKHRFKGGMHATHNNTLWSGKTMVTGHLHALQVRPFSDYSGTRWGVDTGTMADPYGPQFDYQEDNPRNHRSGFVVLTFADGQLLDPETVRVRAEGEVVFRGAVHHV